MTFSMHPYAMGDDDLDDYTDIPLKLHSVFDFLDGTAAAASADGGITERQHVSSNVSDEESDADVLTRRSVRLTALDMATAHRGSRECYCLDNAHCMCGQFLLPPLLTRRPTVALSQLTFGLATSGPEAAVATTAARRTDTVSHTAEDPVHIPISLSPVRLAAPVPVMSLAMLATTAAATSTKKAGCRC
ncbi:hypothetical protein NESM_000595000 [Novymonas esmeraldas]|uniref:Uncharacterized protein n=1 Tax=Novymonas esmeraldas TaxID=1808958 RepID=A0AAW0ERB3_9TRYP